MFTGIIEGTGKIEKISKSTTNRSAVKITVNLGNNCKSLKVGQSVALNGVCLTVTKRLPKNRCNFELIDETIQKTNLGDNLKTNSIVNVERSLRAGDRLEGHFVLGHVDGTAIIKKIQKKPKEVQVWFSVSPKLGRYIVKKGSITIDGISLTIVEKKKDTKQNTITISVCLIPHTISITNFATKKVGDTVNIETDILGKYMLDK